MSEHDRETSELIGAAVRATAAQVDASPELRERIAQERRRRTPSARRRPAAASLVAGGVALAVAVVVAAVFALVPGGAGGPSVADAATVALRAPAEPAPAVDPANPRLVQASIAGIRFPNYAYDSPWRTIGARAETLGARRSRTVTYARGTARIGYTIVDGAPLPAPSGSRPADADGTRVWVARLDGAIVVSWERSGHTCVLASRAATLPQMLRFVAWRDEA